MAAGAEEKGRQYGPHAAAGRPGLRVMPQSAPFLLQYADIYLVELLAKCEGPNASKPSYWKQLLLPPLMTNSEGANAAANRRKRVELRLTGYGYVEKMWPISNEPGSST